jgi:hypothetical protein
VDKWNVIFAGVSAGVALLSAIAAAIAAVLSRSAKREAEEKRDEAVEAAKGVASGVGRLVEMQESRDVVEESAQAYGVVFELSEVQRGFTGWRVRNDSDQPVTNVAVRGTTGLPIVVYRGSGPDSEPEYFEHALSAHQQSQLMFRPTGTTAVRTNPAEAELMAVRFTDARNQIWDRVGGQPPRRLSE